MCVLVIGCIFPTPLSNPPSAGCPTLQLNSGTIHLEPALDPHVRGSDL